MFSTGNDYILILCVFLTLQGSSRKQYELQDVKHDWENPVLPLSYPENGLFPPGS